MARPEAVAVGLYYPTPISLLTSIAGHLKLGSGDTFSIVDPCAADGDAAFGVAEALFPRPVRTRDYPSATEWLEACSSARSRGEDQPARDPDLEFMLADKRRHNARLYTCELESTRFEKLKHRPHGLSYAAHQPVHGDALRLTWERVSSYGSTPPGASLLFLNPPYDFDRETKRLEERFLARFTDCLSDAGVLVFLVPFYSLAASADTLAKNFTDLKCYRFPPGDFEIFKQVALFATRRPALFEPDPSVRAQVIAWSESVDTMPILGSASDTTIVPGFKHAAFSDWKSNPIDLRGLLSKANPWHSSDRSGRMQPVAGVVPGDGDLLVRQYPLATPPKPAHIAAGIAAGVFNGARVTPDDPASKLPPLLVKGVFDKEFVTVDNKVNKDGEKTGEIQVQQPKLRVTVLDISCGVYHTLKSSAQNTNASDPGSMTTGDLIASYGKGLMRVMLEQCPVMHDGAREDHQLELPELPRKLYKAQAQAVMAAVKLIGGLRATRAQRRGKSALVLGEIGSGKSSVALATAAAIDAKRVLVMGPPHLVDSWKDQAAAVVPWAAVHVLTDVASVDAWASSTDTMSLAVLSRETAKLGHAWAGVTGKTCPKCGRGLPIVEGKCMPADDLAKKRMRCDRRSLLAQNVFAVLAQRLALAMLTAAPAEPEVAQVLRGTHLNAIRKAAAQRGDSEARWPVVRRSDAVCSIIGELALLAGESTTRSGVESIADVLMGLLAAVEDHDLPRSCHMSLVEAGAVDMEQYGQGYAKRTLAKDLLLLCASSEDNHGYAWNQRRDALLTGKDDPESHRTLLTAGAWNKTPRGSVKCAVAALAKLTKLGAWGESEACGEPLFQAIPEPRRYPLATYISRRYPRLIDLLVIDEGQEYSGDGSAQGFAAARLASLGAPVLMLTGSVMNGYAESLFSNQWSLDPEFRREFSRGDRAAFVRRYGYLKQLVEEKDEKGKVQVFGSHTDRVERTARTIGTSPGVLPIFVLRYLLRLAVTLHKADLALDMPKCHEIVEFVHPTDKMMSRYKGMASRLKECIKRDRFDPELAGKLFGQMSELPSYLDRATVDTGNTDDGAYVVAYPDGRVVAREEGLPSSDLLPKEQWMLDRVRAELAEGRRVMVFGWHENVLPRLHRILERELGESVALLLASKVQSVKRQSWIDAHVIAKKRRVLVVNPVCVQTGLNNLVWFCSQIWMQNPGCNPIIYRQALGRVDRIGQKLETRIFIPVYENTAQALAHKLLLHKVGVSLATDGLDAESALSAAGVGTQDSFDGFSVGRVLFDMMDRDEPMVRVAAPAPAPAPAPTVPLQRRHVANTNRQLDLFGKVA